MKIKETLVLFVIGPQRIKEPMNEEFVLQLFLRFLAQQNLFQNRVV